MANEATNPPFDALINQLVDELMAAGVAETTDEVNADGVPLLAVDLDTASQWLKVRAKAIGGSPDMAKGKMPMKPMMSKTAMEKRMEQMRGSGPKSAAEKKLERKRGVNPRKGD